MTAMNTLSTLQKQAISSAKMSDWSSAIQANQEIIDLEPENVGALNRLGFCFLQVNEKKKAKHAYQKVLEIEKLNTVAKKYLDIIDKDITFKSNTSRSYHDFVEEPGKTKIVQLDRLCEACTLEQLSVATQCSLKPKGRYVTVIGPEGEYIGSLPEDISVHLSQLIKTGNEYDCVIRSVNKNTCSVFIKEKKRSLENQFTPSFFANSKFASIDSEDVLVADFIVESESDTSDDDASDDNDQDDADSKEQLPADILNDVMTE